MERLQAAIEKARAQRPAARGRPGRRGSTALTCLPVAPTPSVQSAWTGLREMPLETAALKARGVVTDSDAPGADAFNLIRARLLQQARQNGWRRIGVSSVHAGCGATTVVANLLIGLTRQPTTRSLVFDFDLRRRGLSSLLGQSPEQDLADVLAGRARFSDLACRHGTHLAAAFARAPARDPAEALQAPATAALLDEVQATYQPDLMLFDLPPVTGTHESLGILERLDCVLLIAAAGATTLPQIDRAEREVAELTKVMGIVVNKCRAAIAFPPESERST